MSLRQTLVAPPLHDPLRSVELVRFAVALVLLSHPLHVLLRPDDAVELGQRLAERSVPAAEPLAWLGLAAMLVAGTLLLFRRWAAAGAALAALVVGVGSALLYAPNWYVVGGLAKAGHPGLEFSVLVLVELAAVFWTWRARTHEGALAAARTGFLVASLGSALLLVPHGYGPFVRWDFEGMRRWGESMTAIGFPHGVALVWGLKVVEQLGSLGRLTRRLVVPACLGHLCILVPGIFIDGEVSWFVVGPGEGGCEYALLLIAGAVATIFAYVPSDAPVVAAEPAKSVSELSAAPSAAV